MRVVALRKIFLGTFVLLLSCVLIAYFGGMLPDLNIRAMKSPVFKERVPTNDSFNHTILLEDKSPLRSIVFLETANHSVLTARQACAVESAARAHPGAQVRFLHTAPEMNMQDLTTKLILETSGNRSLGNVVHEFLNLSAVFLDTPLESWYKKGDWHKSDFAVSHMSDALRFAVVHRFGGVYMDLDVVVIRSLDDLNDFVGLEDSQTLGSAVLGFHREHPFLMECMQELGNTYRPDIWAYNGPGVLTRVLKRFCGGVETQDLNDAISSSHSKCQGVVVVPPMAFYPVHWQNWLIYFNSSNPAEVVIGWIDSYVIHFWNRLTAKTPIVIGSGQPYELAAKKFCPLVYGLVGKSGVM